MSIKHAVLGLLNRNPNYGYALLTLFEEELGTFWDLNYGQVYQVLSALERDGFVTGSDARSGNRPPRRVYSVTSKGNTELERWLGQPSQRRRPFRDEFFVRLLFAIPHGRAFLHGLLASELRGCRANVGELTSAASLDATESVAQRLCAEAALMHARTDLEVVERCVEVLGLTPKPVAASQRHAVPA